MYCTNCGTKLPDHARFCTNCGTAIPASAAGSPANIPDPQQDNTQPSFEPGLSGTQAASGILRFLKIFVPALAVLAVVLSCVLLFKKDSRKTDAENGSAAPAVTAESTAAADTGSEASGVSAAENAAVSEPSVPGTAQAEVTNDDGTKEVVTVTALPRPSFIRAAYAETSDVQPSLPSYTVNPDLSNVDNASDIYLPDEAKQILSEYGFFVYADTGGEEFYSTYESNRYMKRPNFVTTDSLMHIYHLYFSRLLKNTEKNYLRASLESLSVKMTEKSAQQLEMLRGTEWEDAARLNTAFFAVGSLLLDQSPIVPEDVYSLASEELGLIRASAGISDSPLMNAHGPEPAIAVDYSQYIVRGYYEGDPVLEGYFRAMMWYGQMNFTQSDETLDRSALLMTLAFDGETLPTWEAIYSVTAFFAGASDDCGYYEYRPAIDASYGTDVTAADLAGNDAAWQTFHLLTSQMEPPKINSLVNADDGEDHNEAGKGFRFMGQRFSIDAAVFQNLVYNKVGSNASGENRMLPDALDIPAALGSDAALRILEGNGDTQFAGYTENMQKLRTDLENEGDGIWTASLYSQWLNTLRPLLTEKGEGYPSFMQGDAWARKSVQTFLGSYAELKHDTVLYSKQIMVEMGGDNYDDKDDRGYVEPEPEVFGRLAALTDATADGLASYGLLADDDAENLSRLSQLSSSLAEIARRELTGEAVTDDEYELIRNYGGSLEHFWQEVYKEEMDGQHMTGRDFPAAIVTDIATDPNGSVLEIGTGKTGVVYAVVPVDGTLRVASGTVFGFYEFEQPLSDRLTDSSWRQMMGIELNDSGSYSEPSVSLPDWTKDFQKTWRDLG